MLNATYSLDFKRVTRTDTSFSLQNKGKKSQQWKVSTLDNIDEKQALSKSIQCRNDKSFHCLNIALEIGFYFVCALEKWGSCFIVWYFETVADPFLTDVILLGKELCSFTLQLAFCVFLQQCNCSHLYIVKITATASSK